MDGGVGQRGSAGMGGGPVYPPPRIAGLERFTLIGSGGSAVVWRARETAFNRRVAVKVLQQYDERAVRRFERECLAVGGLEHPNIVRVYHAGRTDDTGAPYLTMEYLPRGSLADRHFGWQEAVDIVVKLTGGLETAHRRGVLHRDIKPENVLMNDFGEPKLADFGIAGLAGASLSRSALQTFTPNHVPPEVIRPLMGSPDGGPVTAHRPSARVDVYSLGSTLFNLISGHAPFAREDDEWPLAMLPRIFTEPVPDLRTYGVPDAIFAVIRRAMAKEPANRPRTALQLGDELRDAQEAVGVVPTPLPFWPLPVDDHSGLQPAIHDDPPPVPEYDGRAGAGHPPAAPPTLRPPAVEPVAPVRRLPPTVRRAEPAASTFLPPAAPPPPPPVAPPAPVAPAPSPAAATTTPPTIVPVQFVAVQRPPTRRPVAWAIGVVLALVVAAGVALVLTRMVDSSPPTSPEPGVTVASTAPPGSQPATTTPGTTPTTQPGPPAPTKGSQAAGLYATATFAPVLQYRLPDGGWSIAEGDTNADLIELTRGDNKHVLNFIRAQRVYRPTGPILTADDALRAVEPAQSVANWLVTHPQRKEKTPSQPVSRLPAGADSGVQVDFTVSPGYAYENCSVPCALLFQLDGNRPAVKLAGERTRFYVFRVGGDVVVASVSAPDADFDSFARLAEQIIAGAELRKR